MGGVDAVVGKARDYAHAGDLRFSGITAAGDVDVLHRLTGLLDSPDPDFAIVTP